MKILRLAALIAGCLGLLVSAGAPASANDIKKFQGTIAAPGGGAESAVIHACPKGGEANGSTYIFFDLKADFTAFKVAGPKHLVNEPSPVGVHAVNDYDLDLFVFDAKCKELPSANSDAGVEKLDVKKPARYALVQYFTGVIPELPVTLEACNCKIK
jgi:hypothetical protein